ncbi:VQ motif-containing protein 4 [Hibiscus syriacus]|uniref:VQ motif-containing protein 4 n=1 Tax=Hibiscus syriacus TaxID=106335 RepID=A0A6A3AHK6_HIBSY|nr:VQ motif-containing protein 19-like [Hibiscus syriacus]KAE8703263.1 VQ motif-containing protein 4 [Hibiscus syriacus]
MENSTRLVQDNNGSLNFPSSSSSSSSPLNSPHSNSGTNNSSNGVVQIHTPPLTPIPISRSQTNPYPTTFVQADTTSFKQVVQMLTGSSETAKQASSKPPTQQQQHHHQDHQRISTKSSFPIPPMKTNSPKKQNFKLYERRNSNLKNNLMMINTFLPSSGGGGGGGGAFYSPRNAEILSPSLLDFPKLALSPVTPLNEDTINKASPSLGNSSEEDKAIAEKGFYLHPSPMSTPRDTELQLLPLFPVTSPRLSSSSS